MATLVTLGNSDFKCSYLRTLLFCCQFDYPLDDNLDIKTIDFVHIIAICFFSLYAIWNAMQLLRNRNEIIIAIDHQWTAEFLNVYFFLSCDDSFIRTTSINWNGWILKTSFMLQYNDCSGFININVTVSTLFGLIWYEQLDTRQLFNKGVIIDKLVISVRRQFLLEEHQYHFNDCIYSPRLSVTRSHWLLHRPKRRSSTPKQLTVFMKVNKPWNGNVTLLYRNWNANKKKICMHLSFGWHSDLFCMSSAFSAVNPVSVTFYFMPFVLDFVCVSLFFFALLLLFCSLFFFCKLYAYAPRNH